MTAPQHRYRNSYTGLVEDLTEDQASSFPTSLYRVADNAKPFEPGLFKPGAVGEFENPEPLTDEQIAAEDELKAVLEDHGPQSKAAKEAKAAKDAADEAAAAEAAAAADQAPANDGAESGSAEN